MQKTKLRLLLFEECNRNCEGCCNKDWNLKNLPGVGLFTGYKEIILTGGEPMLRPQLIKSMVRLIRFDTNAPIYVYTAKVDDLHDALSVLNKLDGMTVTLHEQSDVKPFLLFNDAVLDLNNQYGEFWNKSLRLNVFKGIKFGADLSLWDVKKEVEWIKNCPLPEDEVFMRL